MLRSSSRSGRRGGRIAIGNPAPSDLALSASTVPVNAAAGAVIGTISVTDPGEGSWSFTITAGGTKFALSAGSGATVNLIRGLSGTLTAGVNEDVTVQVTDGASNTYSETFTLSVFDPALAAQLTTFTMTNTSGGTQAGGWVSPLFGVVIPPGEIPSGSWPQFRLNDGTTILPATIGMRRSHADGTWRHCVAFFRCPDSVAGSGSITIQLWRAPTAPSASGIANSAASAADLKMEIDGVTGRTGTFTSSLNAGVTDNDDVVVYADGDAGKLISVGQDYMQSGSADGQLYGKWYALLTKDGSGNFGGIRYLCRTNNGFVDVTSPSAQMLTINARLMSGGATTRTLQGTNGSNTIGTTFTLAHYTRLWSCGINGRWDYAQAGGSQAADCTMSPPVWTRAWRNRSRVIPPFDESIANPAASTTWDFHHNAPGPIQRNIDSAGEWDYIAIIPAQCVRHWYLQTPAEYDVVRSAALIQGFWRTCLVRSATKYPVVLRNATYTGLGTAQPTWRYRPGNSVIGFVSPSPENNNNNAGGWFGDTNSAHKPNYAWYAYIVTGSPELFDLCVEQAVGTTAAEAAGTTTYQTLPLAQTGFTVADSFGRVTTINGVTYDGGLTVHEGNQDRVFAWATRDQLVAEVVQPDALPSGIPSGLSQYMRDLVDASTGRYAAWLTHIANDTWRNSGSFYYRSPSEPKHGPWATSYFWQVMGLAQLLRPNAATLTACEQGGRWYTNGIASFGTYGVATYDLVVRDHTGFVIENMNERMIDVGTNFLGQSIAFDAATDILTYTGGGNITNGDYIGFKSSAPGTWAQDRKRLVVLNAGIGGPKTFQLAELSAPTVPLDVTSTGSVNTFYMRLANMGTLINGEDGTSYLGGARNAIRMLRIAGITGLDDEQTALSSAITTDGRALNPKYLIRDGVPT